MYIKSLTLKNFQKHTDLHLEFTNGVNILYGSSDAGKSCIRRAIEWCLFNETFDGVRKVDTKQTSVNITLHNNSQIERVRSQAINRIILRKDGKEQIFDSIGKSLPDEIIKEIGIYPLDIDGEQIYLNSQPQIGLPFLFDKSPSFRAKIFNKLTGYEVLDNLFTDLNKSILQTKRTLKEETNKFEEKEIQLKSCKNEYEKAEFKHTKLKTQIQHIKELNEKYSKLLEIKELLEKNNTNTSDVKVKLKNLKFPQVELVQQLKENIAKYDKTLTVKNTLEKTKAGLDRVGSQLKGYHLPEVNLDELQGKIEAFNTLKSIQEKVDKNQKMRYTIDKNSRIIEKELMVSIINYKKLLKEARVCPICQNEIDDKHLEGLHL